MTQGPTVYTGYSERDRAILEQSLMNDLEVKNVLNFHAQSFDFTKTF